MDKKESKRNSLSQAARAVHDQVPDPTEYKGSLQNILGSMKSKKGDEIDPTGTL